MAMYTSDDIGVFLAIANFHSLHLEKDLAHRDCDVFESICEAIFFLRSSWPNTQIKHATPRVFDLIE